MAETIEYHEWNGSVEDHLALLQKRIDDMEADLQGQREAGNDLVAADLEERIERAKEEKQKFEEEHSATV